MAFPEDYKDRVKRINADLMATLEVMEDKTLKAAMSHYPAAGGKRLRPLLATMACEAVGGKWEAAVPFGVSLELVHNFTLVHDDVMDEDDMRRGIRTVHSQWGVPEAILAGDAMFARAFEVVLETDVDGERTSQLVGVLARAVRLLAEGQQMDMSFERMKAVTAEEYIKMIERKTAVLYSAAAQGGAIVGGASESVQEELFEYGRLMGIAFQIWDDVLDLRSDQKTFGKPVLNDIRNGKKTIIVVDALSKLDGKAKAEFLQTLGKKEATEKELLRARYLLESVGSIDHAARGASENLAAAKGHLAVLKEGPHREALKTLADFMMGRKT